MNNEVIFFTIAELEQRYLSIWKDQDPKNIFSKESSTVSSKLAEKLISKEELSLFSLVSIALGVCGALITREAESRRNTKLLSGSAYILVDRLSEQVAIKSMAAYLYGSCASGAENTSSLRYRAKLGNLISNTRVLLTDMCQLTSIAPDLEKFGAFSSKALEELEAIRSRLSLEKAVENYISELAA